LEQEELEDEWTRDDIMVRSVLPTKEDIETHQDNSDSDSE